jgi:hypothetical protein
MGADAHSGAPLESDSTESDEDRKFWAKCALHPTWHGANAVGRLTCGGDENLLPALLDELGERVRAVTRKGDLSQGHAMLTGQAHTLQSLHYHLLERAFDKYISSTDMELFLRYSLKAQSQCRRTIETQANLVNPRGVALMQTNIAENIQVNNAPALSDRPKIAQSKLLGADNGKRLDSRPESQTSGRDTLLETVGALNGAKVGCG